MSVLSPKSYLNPVANDLVCYDLEFGNGGAAHKGYEFHHPHGLYLAIDVDKDGIPLAMTLIHKKGAATYSATSDYDAFVEEAKKTFVFAKAMIAFAKIVEELRERAREFEDSLTALAQDLICKLREIEGRYGPQRRAA